MPREPDLTLFAGYDHIVGETIVPNGRAREDWAEGPFHPLLDYNRSEILAYLPRGGIDLVELSVDEVAGSGRRWFYFVRPTALPDFAKLFVSLRDETLRDIGEGRCFMVVDYSRQGYSDWIFPRLYAGLEAAPDLRRDQVILLCGDANCEGSHDTYAASRSLEPIRVHYVNMFRQTLADEAASRVERGSYQGDDGEHERRRFLSLNRRNRVHRQLLVSRLFMDDLLAQGYVSLPDYVEGMTSVQRQQMEEKYLLVPSWVLNELSENFPQLAPHLPLTVDRDDLTGQLVHTYTEWPYRATGFSVVTETLYFDPPDVVFLTEKIWKPIMWGHPFIVFGNTGVVAELNRLGFDTFGHVMDIEYDAIVDHGDRFNAAYGALRAVLDLPSGDFADFTEAARDSVEHNQQLLLATKDYERPGAVFRAYIAE